MNAGDKVICPNRFTDTLNNKYWKDFKGYLRDFTKKYAGKEVEIADVVRYNGLDVFSIEELKIGGSYLYVLQFDFLKNKNFVKSENKVESIKKKLTNRELFGI